MRRPLSVVLAAAVATLAAAVPAGASVGAQYGIQDDAWLMDGPGTLEDRVAILERIGVKLVRVTLRWDEVAPREPSDARDPADPAYDWGAYATLLDTLHADRITTLVTLYGSPAWANGGHGSNRLPESGAGNFAYAASKEFPWVRLWTAWNEPNNRTFSIPVSPALYVRRVLNPVYVALHDADDANRVAGGVTSPRRLRVGCRRPYSRPACAPPTRGSMRTRRTRIRARPTRPPFARRAPAGTGRWRGFPRSARRSRATSGRSRCD